MDGKNDYRYCAVPCCGNTSIKTPTKLFIHVRVKKDIRNKWLKVARVNLKHVSSKTRLFFCEDHFDLPHDMENYMEFKIMGSVKRINLKANCMPTRFNFHSEEEKCDKCMPIPDAAADKRISVEHNVTNKKDNGKQSLIQTEYKLQRNINAEDSTNVCSDLEEMDLCMIKKEEEFINEEIENIYKYHIVKNDFLVTSEIVHNESGINQSNNNKSIENINETVQFFGKDKINQFLESEKTIDHNVNFILKKETEVVNKITHKSYELIEINLKKEQCELKDVNLFIKNEKEIVLEDEDIAEYLNNNEKTIVKIENLYEDHIVKEEIVVGPEIIQEVNSSNFNPNNTECSSLIKKGKLKNKKFICDYCQETFYTRGNIQKHLRQHKTTKWNCHLCSKSYSFQTNLWRHLKTHWDIKPHSCSQCTKTFTRKDYLKFHIQTHHGNIPESTIVRVRSTCDLCHKEFSSKHSCGHHKKYSCPMNKNKQKLRKTKVYICDVCDKSYIYRCSLSAHIMRHHMNKHGGSIHECDICGKKYMKKHNLKCHMQSKHLQSKPYKCKKCKLTFTWYSTLAGHEKKMHGKIRGKCLKKNP